MLYQILAEITLLIHFLFIVYVVFGALLVLKLHWTVYIHIPAAFWGALIMFMGWICPLTPLENRFRRLAGGEGYDAGFIEHYIWPIVYPEGLTRELQIYLGIGVVVLNVIIYGIFIMRKRGK
jgi:hypothetical protein